MEGEEVVAGQTHVINDYMSVDHLCSWLVIMLERKTRNLYQLRLNGCK